MGQRNSCSGMTAKLESEGLSAGLPGSCLVICSGFQAGSFNKGFVAWLVVKSVIEGLVFDLAPRGRFIEMLFDFVESLCILSEPGVVAANIGISEQLLIVGQGAVRANQLHPFPEIG